MNTRMTNRLFNLRNKVSVFMVTRKYGGYILLIIPIVVDMSQETDGCVVTRELEYVLPTTL